MILQSLPLENPPEKKLRRGSRREKRRLESGRNTDSCSELSKHFLYKINVYYCFYLNKDRAAWAASFCEDQNRLFFTRSRTIVTVCDRDAPQKSTFKEFLNIIRYHFSCWTSFPVSHLNNVTVTALTGKVSQRKQSGFHHNYFLSNDRNDAFINNKKVY